MSVIRFDDPWLRNGKVVEEIHQYLLASHKHAVSEATLCHAMGLTGGDTIELVVVLNDDHPHSDKVSDEIHEMLIQARLDFAQCHVLHALAWSFSSPAHISKLRELLDVKKK